MYGDEKGKVCKMKENFRMLLFFKFFVAVVQRKLHKFSNLVVYIVFVHETQVVLMHWKAGSTADTVKAKIVFIAPGEGECHVNEVSAYPGYVAKPDFSPQADLRFGGVHFEVADLFELVDKVVKKLSYFGLSPLEKAFECAVVARVVLVFPTEAVIT